MPVQDRLLHRAISLYQVGDCKTARRILLGILRNDESNQIAWLWYIETFSTLEERLTIYRNLLAKYPQMEQVRQAHLRLKQSLPRLVEPRVERIPHTPPAPAHYPPVKQSATQSRKSAWPGLSILIVGLLSFIIGLLLLRVQVESVKVLRLQQDNRAQKSRLELMSAQNDNLSLRLDTLTRQYISLNTEHQQLQGEYQSLVNKYNDLNSKAVIPPYIIVSQREVKIAFNKLDHSLLYWTVPFESLESDIERGYSSRKNITSPDANIKLTDNGKDYYMVDFRPYVDSNIFAKVIPQIYTQAENDEVFIREVWNIVTQLATYASDPETETPRYPLETLLAGGGDCEDTSILFASMVKAAPVSWKISLV